jgi:3-deoxy-7-phosphoheptulonate synthase
MIIALKNNAQPKEKENLFNLLNSLSIAFQYIEKQNIVVLPKFNEPSIIKNQPAVESIYEIETPYQLASNVWKKKTSFNVGGIEISNSTFNIIAGPCSVENEEQVYNTAEFLSKNGIKFIRGGAFKPRTSPYSFRGLGVDGLKLLHKAAQEFDLRVVTEILDLSLLDDVYQYTDILQVGSRNMQNFFLLNELGKIDKPILLKRGMSAKLNDWLLAAEYILCGGNDKVILCERGIRSFDPMSRNVLDLGIISLAKELSHLPIIIDPSHGTGMASRVMPMALAAAAAGADGLIIEIHPEPSKALSDSQQALSFNQFSELLSNLNILLQNLPYSKSETHLNSSVLKLQSL